MIEYGIFQRIKRVMLWQDIKTMFMCKIVNDFKRNLTGKIGRQTFTLFFSQIAVLFLGIFTSIINTRILGPEGYGILAFFFSITSFTVLFFRFGFFSSSGLLIAQAKEEIKGRELTGAFIIISFFIGVFYAIFVFILSFFVDDIFHTDIGWILRYTSVLLIAMPISFLIPQVGRGMNKIEAIALYKVIPKLFYIIGALAFIQFVQIEPFHFILLNLFVSILSFLVVINQFHPLFCNIKNNLCKIWKKTKEYGFNLYIGQIADQSTYHLGTILITYFVNTTQLGFYALASSIASPIALLSSALCTSLFKKFVDMDEIPKKIIYYNFLWLSACVVGLAILGKYIIILLFSEKFLPVVPLILPLSLASFFQGMYQPYLHFVLLKVDGKNLRNVALFCAVINLLFNLILIPLYGAYGAAIASFISMVTWYVMLKKLYNGSVRR